MSGHRLVHIHSCKRRNIKTGQPHIHNNCNFQRTVVILEFPCKLILVMFITDNLTPFFRVIITGSHYNCNLFLPSRAEFQYTLVNLHGDRAGIRNNHCLTGQQIFTVIFVMVKNIANKGINGVIVSEYSFHLSKLTLTLFDDFLISIGSHNVILCINHLQSCFIKIELNNTAFIINRACCSILNRLCHIVNVDIITEHLTSAAVFGRNRRTCKSNICSVR